MNLNDVGQEAGFAAGSSFEIAIGGNSNNYTQGPYYLEAKLKIRTFARPGQWSDTSCGTSSTAKTTANGLLKPNNQGSTTNTTGSGKDWMTNMCSNPP